jgi:hypothetical protein
MRFHGIGINWGVNSTIIGVNGLFQTREHSSTAKSKEIVDGGETTVSKAYWDFKQTATFTYVAAQYGGPFGNSNVDVPTIGNFVTVFDPSYAYINGDWLVDAASVASSNTSAARVTLTLSRYPNLQRI